MAMFTNTSKNDSAISSTSSTTTTTSNLQNKIDSDISELQKMHLNSTENASNSSSISDLNQWIIYYYNNLKKEELNVGIVFFSSIYKYNFY